MIVTDDDLRMLNEYHAAVRRLDAAEAEREAAKDEHERTLGQLRSAARKAAQS